MAPLPILTVVIPCYNEEEVLPETIRRVGALVDAMVRDGLVAGDSHVLFVDDGSRDRTWRLITAARSTRFGGLRLSRNVGHQNALMAGLLEAKGDFVASMDADLQDDPDALRAMVEAAREGAEIVYGVRRTRTTDSFGKRTSAQLYYRLLHWLGVDVIFDHGDFRLMSRQAIEALRRFEESNLFLRALVPRLGFETRIVTYDRTERFAGTSKYPLGRMVALAVEGVTSFTTRPLRLVTMLGLIMSAVSAVLTLWALVNAGLGNTVPGWASIVVPIYLACGIQLFCLGIIGEYVGKIYLEAKRRPRFIVSQSLQPDDIALPGGG